MTGPDRNLGRRTRSAARLAAVQAIYQIELAGAEVEAVVGEFLAHRLSPATAEPEAASVDKALFAELVRGVASRRPELDSLLTRHLSESWALDRLELVLAAILRAATFELLARTDVPPRVTLNEYVDVAHAFYAGKEPGFVNGVLDRIARELRPQELDNDNRSQQTRTAG
ncbi:MAG: transcription antitermination factor NusB [Proteobacteria bacterium]|nr:transcription antitermination factor NusB [Pseudomonadota bacterium]MBI3496026.1 transcription antitermination factor NusB [Pseudomonadota bacterium]